MQYPLSLALHLTGPTPGFNVTDADGRLVWDVKVDWDRANLDLHLTVLQDGKPQYEVRTTGGRDYMRYTLLGGDTLYPVTDGEGQELGAFKRVGGLSGAWQAQYEWLDRNGQVALRMTQEQPAGAVLNAMVESIPVVGELIASQVLNPTYAVCMEDGTAVRRLNTGRFLLVPTYTMDHLAEMPAALERMAVLGAMMMVFHEQSRS